jgi:hypothetical protein
VHVRHTTAEGGRPARHATTLDQPDGGGPKSRARGRLGRAVRFAEQLLLLALAVVLYVVEA